MSVRKRKWKGKDGKVREAWMVHIERENPDGTPGAPVRKLLSGMSKRDAEAWERRALAEVMAGAYGRKEAVETKPAPLLSDFEREFVANYATTNNKPSEVETKRTALRVHLVPAFGGLRLDQIDERKIEAFKADRLSPAPAGGGLAPKSVNNLLTILRKLLVVAAEWRLIDRVPRVKWLKAPKPGFDFLDFEEADRLEAVAEEGLWRTMVLLGLRTGLRQGELIALRWDEVDLVSGRLRVCRSVSRGIVGTPKSGRSRELPLSDEACRALKAHRHLKGELVFSDEKGGMLTKGECKHPLWRSCKKAGLRRIGWHVLRHTFASHLVMQGVPLKAVQELLGHATIEMTMRYSHLSPQVTRNAVALLDRSARREINSTLTAHGGAEIEKG